MTITRDIVDLDKTLLETMKVINSNRFIYGSSHRINGIQLTRIEPCNILLFTSNPKFKSH
jgi:hypothetical protein